MSASHLAALPTKLLNNKEEQSLSVAELFTLIRHKVKGRVVKGEGSEQLRPISLKHPGTLFITLPPAACSFCHHRAPMPPHPPSSAVVSLNNNLLSDHTDENMATPQMKQNLVHCAHTTATKEQKQSA